MVSRQRNCSKCDVELVNSTGVHMGIPFGLWHTNKAVNPMQWGEKMIVCAKCYDEVTIVDNIQRTGEQVV